MKKQFSFQTFLSLSLLLGSFFFCRYSFADSKDDQILDLQNQIAILQSQIYALQGGTKTSQNYRTRDSNDAVPGSHFICLYAAEVFPDSNTKTYAGISPKLSEALSQAQNNCLMNAENNTKCLLIKDSCHQEPN